MFPTPPIEVFEGLVGVPAAETNCWGLVVRGLRFYGVLWPETWQEAITAEQDLAVPLNSSLAIRPGDVMEFQQIEPVQPGTPCRHVGLVVAADVHGWSAKVLHATREKSRIDTVTALRKTLRLIRAVRPRELCLPQEVS